MPLRFKLAASNAWFGAQIRLAAIGAVAGLLLAGLFLSDSPARSQVHVGRDSDPRNADCAAATRYCEGKDKKKAKSRPKAEPISAQQRTLLQTAFDRLLPQRPGVVDFYTIGIAGWAAEDVFIKELGGALASLEKVLPIDGRVVRLVNHRSTVRATPLATRDNLAAAVGAVAQKMDRDEDVLILFMTSHGNKSGFGLRLPGKEPVGLPPQEVAAMLDGAGIKHRLVIVSACFSGIFVPPLANDTTVVMTAADADHPSFGCAPGREWTFFGDALFNRSLKPGVDLMHAFGSARTTISEWELMEGYQPSNPQAHFGPALVEKLAPLLAAPAGGER
jgi:hypothetical protein